VAGLTPLVITATVQQGVVIDPRYGIALDGLLATQLRSAAAVKAGHARAGAELDGGLGLEVPDLWEVPLGRCTRAGQDWHWLASVGMPVDHQGRRVPWVVDAHRLLGDLDETRTAQVAVSQPMHLGGARGRYRRRITPVLVIPAAQLVWHAVGDKGQVRALLEPLTAIGGRRGSGEGAVLGWQVRDALPVEVSTAGGVDLFAHRHPDGTLGRPCPLVCAEAVGADLSRQGYAGLRPPMFHPGTRRNLVLPPWDYTAEGTPDAQT
jgi:CRISPR type IV-associated protein Csf3